MEKLLLPEVTFDSHNEGPCFLDIIPSMINPRQGMLVAVPQMDPAITHRFSPAEMPTPLSETLFFPQEVQPDRDWILDALEQLGAIEVLEDLTRSHDGKDYYTIKIKHPGLLKRLHEVEQGNWKALTYFETFLDTDPECTVGVC